jgi:5-methylcytosine-specific restriction endonuclease McrA
MVSRKVPAIPKDVWQMVAERDMGCAGNAYGYLHRCEGRTVVHHRHLRSQGGDNAETNLVALCNSAHLHVHANPAESYDNGLMVRGV